MGSAIVMNAESVSLVLNGFAITDFAEGDVVELNPVNPLTSHVNGSNGAVNMQKRSDGGVHDLIVRVQKFSKSDVFLNSVRNADGVTVLNGSLKEEFSRDGQDGAESYILENGSITAQPGNKKNTTDGNGLMEYTIRFRNATRNI